MKKAILFFALIISLVLFSSAKGKKEKTDGLFFENTEYNYGKILQNSDGLCSFKFKNESKNPVIITNVKTSCGCTSPQWPKSPIEKGKSDEIKVKYNTANLGSFSKTITVTTNKNQTIVLTIKGEVIKN